MKPATVVHLWCIQCWQPFSARSVDAAREGLLDHLRYAQHPSPLNEVRIRLLEDAQRVVAGASR